MARQVSCGLETAVFGSSEATGLQSHFSIIKKEPDVNSPSTT
jgi:hypothetical protein